MASPIKTVALCSPTGKLGPFLHQALQAQGFSVTVVLRKSSTAVFPSGQEIIRVSDEYHDDELVAAFKEHDAVVLSLSFEMLPHAKRFAQASIAAGNKWFIASTYAANLEDPDHALFPASVPHRQAVDELRELQKAQDTWAWTSISCGPWPELATAARAWNIDPVAKTAQLLDDGRNVFTCTTREQVGRTVARVLAKQPERMKNDIIYVSSFEVSMLDWLNAFKEVVGSGGWTVTHIDSETMLKESQAKMALGHFQEAYVGLALVVCTGRGYQNRFSSVKKLVNEELNLPKEDMVEVVKAGLALPNPFI
ncbi:NAD(P)-binding Rossmann-fold containing protein [Fusarium mexicanum]|uniref:NAD(P)-binding Rossmann-fold containing protein n=1 Tax=Fusarium mexicanum TaxID=751941 RepID=A0A8H5MM58_9HYPO|nr:NAD(P)-binding Rossmann-fold containing protein [Fusarium mexicanum]